MSYNSKTIDSKRHLLVMIAGVLAQLCPVTTATAIETNASSFYNPSVLHFINIKNGIGNYTGNILNMSDNYRTTTSYQTEDHNQYIAKLFSSSLLYYSDEATSNLINRDFVLRRHCVNNIARINYPLHAQIKHDPLSGEATVHTHILNESNEDYFVESFHDEDDDYAIFTTNRIGITDDINSFRCPSCQRHEKAKQENLESIKHHILMRLQLSQPPNITVQPSIPQKILDYFYKNFNYFKAAPSQLQAPFLKNQHFPKSKQKTTVLNETTAKELEQDEIMFNDRTDVDDDNVNDDSDGFRSSLQHGDEFFSHPHSIYIFPTKSRKRHSRQPEIFNFKFNSDPLSISSTTLHIFIRGRDWKHTSDFTEQKQPDVSLKNREQIIIVVYRALRRPNSMNYTHTLKLIESRQKIPAGIGQWVEIEIKELSSYWLKSPNSTQSLVIRGMESWMDAYIVTENSINSRSLTMHIEILTKVKSRHKRNAGLDCHESDNEVRCCRYPLKVNFTNFGWNFIVAPQHFDAYFCNGECNVGYLEKYTHTHITSLTTSAKPCCSPQKLSALALLYFDNNNKLMYSTIPNMSVEKCSCS